VWRCVHPWGRHSFRVRGEFHTTISHSTPHLAEYITPRSRAPAVFRPATQHPNTPCALPSLDIHPPGLPLRVMHGFPLFIVAISVRCPVVQKLSPKFGLVGEGRAYVVGPGSRPTLLKQWLAFDTPVLEFEAYPKWISITSPALNFGFAGWPRWGSCLLW